MPATRKRTSQSKQSPPSTPTTSTLHGQADHHLHHRHTAPGTTSATSSAVPSKPPPPAHPPAETSETGHSEKNKLLAEVAPPGSGTPLKRFIYGLAFLALVFLGWYVHAMVTFLECLKEEVGWWGIVVGDSGRKLLWEDVRRTGWGFGGGDRGSSSSSSSCESKKSDRLAEGGGGGLESSLNALADALGIPAPQVASAVKPLIPQASLTSIASQAGETDGSEVVRILFEDTTRRDDPASTGIVDDFTSKLGKGSAEADVAEEMEM